MDKLWKDYPGVRPVKLQDPQGLKDSALRPEEYAVIFDVSTKSVGVILIREKAVSKAFIDIKLSDLERDVMKFREPFEKFRLKDTILSLPNPSTTSCYALRSLTFPKERPLQ